MKLGIFGGTFDPPHLAHLILAEEAYYQLQLDGILWVLTPIPPHKNTVKNKIKVNFQIIEKFKKNKSVTNAILNSMRRDAL